MEQRIVIGTLVSLVALTLVGADAWISYSCAWGPPWGTLFRRGSLLPVLTAVLILTAACELLNLMRSAGLRPLGAWSLLSCGALMLTPWLASGLGQGAGGTSPGTVMVSMIVLSAALIGSACWLVVRGRIEGGVSDISATWTVVIYMGLFPSMALHLRCDPDIPGFVGAWYFVFFVLVCKFSDIGAYFSGSFWGRHPLTPTISPSKTVEGAVGAITTSSLASLLFNQVPLLFDDWGLGRPGLTVTQAVIFGVTVSLVSQMGDLFESLFKRDARLKDSAALIPSFGGILDLVDSPVLAAPVAWFLLSVWWEVL